jgi:hypothetical protein
VIVPQPCLVLPYSIEVLRSQMAKAGGAAPHVIDRKAHAQYFESYFRDVHAKVIVVESDYIDRDFLDDYSAYYVRCFYDYPRKCTRLHFFSHSFTEAELLALLKWNSGNLSVEALQQSYLGFIVLKPLPQTVVGRTCLRAYPEIDGRRYPILRDYSADIFGIPLSVKTLAFQEQDQVVSACATSALWSAFHGTGKLFQHAIPSPYQITKSASVHFSTGSRDFPNSGLTLEQMADAIRSVGLEPYAVRVQTPFILKNTLYGYLRGRVPALMGLRLYDISDEQHPRFLGKHAITIAGFRLGAQAIQKPSPFGYQSVACQIDKIYAHDDGIGPFARMCFDGVDVTATINDTPEKWMSLSTAWENGTGSAGQIRAVPECLLMPLYHKIRIPLSRVQPVLVQLDILLEGWRSENLLPLDGRIRWDVFLSTVNEFKESVFSGSALSGEEREAVLSYSLPRFMWRATARLDERPLLDLLFDATDIEQGTCFAQAVGYDGDLVDAIQAVVREPATEERLRHLPAWTLLKHFVHTA